MAHVYAFGVVPGGVTWLELNHLTGIGMRFVLVVVALLLAGPARAEDAPNIAGFRLGMSVEEAQAVAPDLFRRAPRNEATFSVTRHSQRFRDTAFPFTLVFVNGTLEYAGGDSTLYLPHLERCFERHQSLVEALESTLGPLGAAENTERRPNARVHDLEPVRTAGGSYISRYTTDLGSGAIAKAVAPISVDVRLWAVLQRDGLWQCWTTYSVSAASAPPADMPESTGENVQWTARPTGADFARYYPRAAVEVERPGDVTLICVVAEDGALDCDVGYENPTGWGFGEAALRLSRHFRAAPQTTDGAPTAGATLRVPIRFQTLH